MPEKRKHINKTYSVDLADSIGASYVPSPRRTAPRTAPGDPYEASELINIGWFLKIFKFFFELRTPFPSFS